jgi:hypothetical protein
VTYTIRWKETSTHEVELSDDEMAALKGCTVAALKEREADDIEDGLADELADLSDDGFEGVERFDIEVDHP